MSYRVFRRLRARGSAGSQGTSWACFGTEFNAGRPDSPGAARGSVDDEWARTG
jgi:hypothetical protein